MERSILIRADGSSKIGLGHLTRQIDIANELKKINYNVLFLSKNFPEGINLLKENDFNVLKLKALEQDLKNSNYEINKVLIAYNQKFNTIMVDIFKDFDNQKYLNNLKKYGDTLFVLSDDPNPFKIDVDAVFAISENQDSVDYKNSKTEYYTGLKYFPLHNKFQNVLKKKIKEQVDNILLTFGGADPKNYSTKLLKILRSFDLNLEITLIIGAGFSKKHYNDVIKEEAENISIKINVNNMNEQFSKADLCICSAGNTLIEALTCGVPCIVLPQTKLENARAMALAIKERMINMGQNFSDKNLVKEIKNLMNDYSKRKRLSQNAQNYLDGKGIKRIIDIISKFVNKK